MTPPARLTLSIDGTWEARRDPDDIGCHDGWYAPGVPFDERLPVPGAWQAANGEFATYSGVAWYRRRFARPAWPAGNVAIRFGAVDHTAAIWLNGRDLGSHDGGYLPFELEAGDALIEGENELVVRVEDTPGIRDRTRGKQGTIWYTPVSGIWQSTALAWRPAEFVVYLHCIPGPSGDVAGISGACRTGEPRTVRLDVLDAAGTVVCSDQCSVAPGQSRFAVDLPVPDARRWQPTDPYLYTVVATLGDIDQITTRFGLRTVDARDGAIWLNGHRQELRGALDQGYWPDSLYLPPSAEALGDEIRRAKELGFNLLRKHIKVEDPRALDFADELGMLIWAEPPNPGRFTTESAAAVRRDLLGMIERDANHPSIVVWCCYNEDWGIEDLWNEPERQAWLGSLVAEVRALDPSRLVCDNSGWAHVSTDLNDYHEYFSLPDRATALEARLDEMERDPDDNFAAGHRADGQPMLVSEIGAWMIPDPSRLRARHGGRGPRWFDHAGGYQRGPGEAAPGADDPLPPIATIHGFEERLVSAGLDRVFDSPADVAAHAQRRGARSIADQLGALRRRSSMAGYVVTELTDTEWEANGWLDHWREPKAVAPILRAANAPVAIVAQPDRRSVVDAATVVLDVVIINDTPEPVVGALVASADGRADTLADAISVPPYSHVDGVRVAWALPSGPSAPIDLELSLVGGDRAIAATTIELARVAGADLVRPVVRANGPWLPRILRQRLERHGYRMRDGSGADLLIVDRLDGPAVEFARSGGRVLHLVGDVVATPDPLGLRYRELPAGESWEMHTGVAWARSDLLRPTPLRADLGWEAAAWFPSSYVLAESLGRGDVQLAGWFEGWAAFAGAFAVARDVGQGRVLTTTFRLGESFGVDPVATVLVDRLVELLAEPLEAGPARPGWAGIGAAS